MQMSEEMEQAMNDQLQAELHSAYIYLSMAAYCERINMTGSSSWLQAQAQEEVEHAMRFYNFINERGGAVKLQGIPEPPTEFDSLLDVFEKALEHEQLITSKINKLYEQAKEDDDYPSQTFLHWFVDEQVEEEDSAQEIVDKLEMVEGKKHLLLNIDQELGKRGEE